MEKFLGPPIRLAAERGEAAVRAKWTDEEDTDVAEEYLTPRPHAIRAGA